MILFIHRENSRKKMFFYINLNEMDFFAGKVAFIKQILEEIKKY